MLTTAANLHNAFLDGIRKSSTTTVKPSLFCRIWNEWAMIEWVRQNVSMREGIELNQKQIDDLNKLYKRVKLVQSGTYKGTDRFILPDGVTQTGVDLMTSSMQIVVLPKYLRAFKVRFTVNYDPYHNECGKSGVSPILKSKYMRSDEEGVIAESVYRKPADHRFYHKIIEGHILFIGGVSKPNACYLDYIRYPNEMTVANEVLTYTPDLYPEQLSEVVTLAVKIYLERVTDQRYKSFLNEEMMRQTTQI